MKGEEFPNHLVNDLTTWPCTITWSHTCTHIHSYSNEINESERRKVMVHMIVSHLLHRGWSQVFLWLYDVQIM